MKLHTRILLSLMAGLLALYCYAAPMWWGALFPSLARRFSEVHVSFEAGTVVSEDPHVTLRLRSLELLRNILDRK